MKKLLLTLIAMFLYCPFPVHAERQFAVFGPTLYVEKSQCIKIKDVKLSIAENKLSLRYILENSCGEQAVNFYALAAKYSCNENIWCTFGDHQKRDFSEFSAFINDKRMDVQHSFVAELDDEDVTDKLLKYNIGYDSCGVGRTLNENEEINKKYKELIDSRLFLKDMGALIPDWYIRHKYSWKIIPPKNKKEFSMRVEYNILGGREYGCSAYEPAHCPFYDPLLLDAGLPYIPLSDDILQLLNIEKKEIQEMQPEAWLKMSYAIIPLGISGVLGETDISLQIRHSSSLFGRFAKPSDVAIKKAPFVAKVYIGKQGMRPDGNFVLKYGHSLNTSFNNISLPENIYIMLIRKSNPGLQ